MQLGLSLICSSTKKFTNNMQLSIPATDSSIVIMSYRLMMMSGAYMFRTFKPKTSGVLHKCGNVSRQTKKTHKLITEIFLYI